MWPANRSPKGVLLLDAVDGGIYLGIEFPGDIAVRHALLADGRLRRSEEVNATRLSADERVEGSVAPRRPHMSARNGAS